MSEVGKYVTIGPYRLALPEGATVSVGFMDINKGVPNRELITSWKISLKNFYISCHLSRMPLSQLKFHIDHTTKSNVFVNQIRVGDIEGVTHGNYEKPRTWIDWWLREGDLTLCMNLQSSNFPWAEVTNKDKETHNGIIQSIIYTPKVGVNYGS